MMLIVSKSNCACRPLPKRQKVAVERERELKRRKHDL